MITSPGSLMLGGELKSGKTVIMTVVPSLFEGVPLSLATMDRVWDGPVVKSNWLTSESSPVDSLIEKWLLGGDIA